MTETVIVFRVAGEPRTNERARHGAGRTYTPQKTRLARSEVVKAFQDEAPSWKPWEGPVVLSVHVSHAAADLWEGRFCRRKPDLDNVAKLVADALNGVAYLDDAQIVHLECVKRYAATSGIEVRLLFSEATEKPKHGRIPHPVTDHCWQVWDHGHFLGAIFRRAPGSYYVADKTGAIEEFFQTLKAAQAKLEQARP